MQILIRTQELTICVTGLQGSASQDPIDVDKDSDGSPAVSSYYHFRYGKCHTAGVGFIKY